MNLYQQFKDEGYIHLKNFFSLDEINALVLEIQNTSLENPSKDILNLGKLTFNSLIMHKSQKLREFIAQPRIIELMSKLMGPNIWIRWDQAVEKGPGAGWFPWHQDNSYSQLKDPHYQLWISLTEMTQDNGGLWILPKSHHQNNKHEKEGHHTVYKGDTSKQEFIGAEIGDVVVFSSFTLHATTPNVTQKSRWAYVVEYMQTKHIDPYIEGPYLVVAKNSKPHIKYVDKIGNDYSLHNLVKYPDIKRRFGHLKANIKRVIT